MYYFIESHYNDFVHISFDFTELYIFKLVTNPLQKLKNGPLYSGHPKLSKFVRFFYVEILQFDYYKDLENNEDYYCMCKDYQSFLNLC